MAKPVRPDYPYRMGYLLVGLLIILFLGFLVMALTKGKPPRGTLHSDKPVVRDKPSAEDVTPGASSTATARQSEHARRHTPPA